MNIPQGYKLVPVEPDDDMQLAGAECIRVDTTPINKIWIANKAFRAMVAAAPDVQAAAPTSADATKLDMSLEAQLADAKSDVARLRAEKMELWAQVYGPITQAATPQEDERAAFVRAYMAARPASVAQAEDVFDQDWHGKQMWSAGVAYARAALVSAPAQSGKAVAEVIRWKTLTGHTSWDFKVFDKTLEHGAKLYAAPQPAQPQQTSPSSRQTVGQTQIDALIAEHSEWTPHGSAIVDGHRRTFAKALLELAASTSSPT